MLHLVAAEGVEGFLHGGNVVQSAGQEAPLGPGVEPSGVVGKTRRGIVVRIDRDRDHPRVRRQIVAGRGEGAGEHRADRRAGGEDELQEERAVVRQGGAECGPGSGGVGEGDLRWIVGADGAGVVGASASTVPFSIGVLHTRKPLCFNG